ncbi:polysaccharide lyase family 7 protein [Trichodelitschia bisporula]|uniref:Polysaccharide lyase family 7 protein n=1 Tax=Trichodelitschia bisporula TaxID=703511 RepID=A0A6G1HLL6_9PEZI|nr:polysaccharide lyase family 7 protein [Trichodelitschia bisporula]
MALKLLALLPLLSAVSSFPLLAPRANPSCAPGGNINLSPWTLQLPIGSPGSPQQIPGSQLAGCSGYQDPGHKYFYTNPSSGALVTKVPGSPASSGCVTTPNSQHCRTELREARSWDPKAGTNKLTATLTVVKADNSGHGTVVGQIHIDDSVSSKPVCELFVNSAGVVAMGVEQTRAGGNMIVTTVGSVDLGGSWSYAISYANGVLTVSVNGGATKTLSTYSLDSPKSYFKAGNYNQGSSASEVHFTSINISH